MDATYEYMDEESIDPELICSICHSPLLDPRCTPCSEIFCRECITNWIQTENASCPHCREALSINVLTQVPRSLRNILDRLPVKCIICGQNGLQRVNFDEHIQKVCPKTVVSCPSADIKCPWTGQRNQLNQHLVDCRFASMRPVITALIDENQQLKDQVNKQTIQISGQQNENRQLKEQVTQQRTQIGGHQNENQQLKDVVNQQRSQIERYQNENQQLKEHAAQFKTQVNTYQHEIQQLNEQLKQKDTHIKSMNSQSRESITIHILRSYLPKSRQTFLD